MTKKDTEFPSFLDVKYNWQQLKDSENGYSINNLYIKNVARKGLGVFSKQNIKKGEVIEYCHAVKLEIPQRWMHDRAIKKYCYWDKSGQGLMPLGFGPIYNSADRDHLKNAHYFLFPEDNLVAFVAQEDILAHEEILVWWGDGYYDSWCKSNS
jgi:hypothetical protein